jgi:hypothetical protein
LSVNNQRNFQFLNANPVFDVKYIGIVDIRIVNQELIYRGRFNFYTATFSMYKRPAASR